MVISLISTSSGCSMAKAMARDGFGSVATSSSLRAPDLLAELIQALDPARAEHDGIYELLWARTCLPAWRSARPST
jgi:hypothetical protein